MPTAGITYGIFAPRQQLTALVGHATGRSSPLSLPVTAAGHGDVNVSLREAHTGEHLQEMTWAARSTRSS